MRDARETRTRAARVAVEDRQHRTAVAAVGDPGAGCKGASDYGEPGGCYKSGGGTDDGGGGGGGGGLGDKVANGATGLEGDLGGDGGSAPAAAGVARRRRRTASRPAVAAPGSDACSGGTGGAGKIVILVP